MLQEKNINVEEEKIIQIINDFLQEEFEVDRSKIITLCRPQNHTGTG